MDLSIIDCFVKVADARSISAAARLHRLPKSTLSHRIRQLEDEFGVELFVREGHHLHVTDAGSELLRHARRIQASCEDAATAMAEMRHEVAGTLRVGSTGEFGTTITSELLFAFRQNYTQVVLDVMFLTSRQPFSDVTELHSTAFSTGENRPRSTMSAAAWRRPPMGSMPAPIISTATACPKRPRILPAIAA